MIQTESEYINKIKMRKLTKNTFGLDSSHEPRREFRQKSERKISQESKSESECFSSEYFDENVAYVTKEIKLVADEQQECEYVSRYNLADRKSSKTSNNKDIWFEAIEEFSQRETEKFCTKEDRGHFETEANPEFCNTLKLNLDKLDNNLAKANLTVPDEFEIDNEIVENIKTSKRQIGNKSSGLERSRSRKKSTIIK